MAFASMIIAPLIFIILVILAFAGIALIRKGRAAESKTLKILGYLFFIPHCLMGAYLEIMSGVAISFFLRELFKG